MDPDYSQRGPMQRECVLGLLNQNLGVWPAYYKPCSWQTYVNLQCDFPGFRLRLYHTQLRGSQIVCNRLYSKEEPSYSRGNQGQEKTVGNKGHEGCTRKASKDENHMDKILKKESVRVG
ncbi:hypothetical protein NDU88_004179 [Pleurodeles waltl]|uniref:Uncharacterized protein n=1 Tax=Pleurodeles waltl TaxID=8319 RepID=A0AAV7T7A4_PLEWA|nr:hypothetical protein NDU88_004179 [Pleurodeles waltl]